MGDKATGLAISQQAVDFGETLLAEEPDNAEKQSALAESLRILVRCSDTTKPDNMKLLNRAAELWQKVSGARPDDLKARAEMAQSWSDLAVANHALRRYAETDIWLDRAYQTMSALVVSHPSEGWLRVRLRQIIHAYAFTRLDVEMGNSRTLGVREGQRKMGQKLLREGIGCGRVAQLFAAESIPTRCRATCASTHRHASDSASLASTGVP